MGYKPDPRGVSARQRFTTHGATLFGVKSPTWIAWCNMRHRCRDKNRPDFHRYGGRGIRVCKRWESFSLFLSDMGEKPDGLTLERIDNDRGYSPSNCTWATRKQQRLNQGTRTHLVAFNGKAMSLKDWSRSVGLSYSCIFGRFKNGWSTRRMLTTPAVIGRNQYTGESR
jgi:hypothetical protein